MLTAQRWARRGPLATAVISGKAVLIEGTEAAVLIVAIGSPQRAFGAAWTGATAAVAVVVMVAIFAQRRLERVTAPILNRIAGTVLLVVGTFWLADGSHLNVLLTVSIPCCRPRCPRPLVAPENTTTQRQQQRQCCVFRFSGVGGHGPPSGGAARGSPARPLTWGRSEAPDVVGQPLLTSSSWRMPSA